MTVIARFTCGGCDESWTGWGRAHCAAPGCHRTFNTVVLFDRHRNHTVDPPRCVDPAELGMRLIKGIWFGKELSDEQKAKLRALKTPSTESESPVPCVLLPPTDWRITPEEMAQFEADMNAALQGDYRLLKIEEQPDE